MTIRASEGREGKGTFCVQLRKFKISSAAAVCCLLTAISAQCFLAAFPFLPLVSWSNSAAAAVKSECTFAASLARNCLPPANDPQLEPSTAKTLPRARLMPPPPPPRHSDFVMHENLQFCAHFFGSLPPLFKMLLCIC